MVSPLISTSALFVFPLSFLINRKIETFHPRVIAGAMAVVIGIFLMFRVA
jgi:drug/metabolite transporter (DMT)-like permease